MKEIRTKIEELEALRREKADPTVATRPIQELDYAGAGLLVQAAMASLDEAIPNRQRYRVQAALMLLAEGASDLVRWCHANNYFSERSARAGYATAMEALEREQNRSRALEEELIKLKGRMNGT